MNSRGRRPAALILGMLLLACVVMPGSRTQAAGSYEDRYVTITLHAGENGYFEEEGITEIESVQFRGDAFYERRRPSSTDPDMLFAGWSKDPAAEEADVFDGMTNVSMVGTDLYAVWRKDCIVNYVVNDGYIETDSGQYSVVTMTYTPGMNFRVLKATHFDSQDFDFDGWYRQIGQEFQDWTEEHIVQDVETDVHARWKFAADRTEYIDRNRKYSMELSGPGVIRAFLPQKDAVYELRTENADGGDGVMIMVMNENCEMLEDSDVYDEAGNAAVSLTMKAGVPYFFQIRDMGGGTVNCTFSIREVKSAVVTFYANRDDKQDAWFDEDQTAVEKKIPIALGTDISEYSQILSGLTFRDAQLVGLVGWSDDPDASEAPESLIVNGDMDVYAVTRELDALILDANGGFFAYEGNGETSTHRFIPGTPFMPVYDPRNDDNTVKFSGWSRDPDAKEPDPDIIEGVTLCDDLGDRLYAVYAEKVLETFDANGGYMLDDPSVTKYYTTKGKGHIFYGMVVHHQNERMKAIGFVDQDGTEIPYTADIYPYYHIKGDTVYTTVWGYTVYVDANGGVFEESGAERLKVLLPYEDPFDLEPILDQIGEVVSEEPDRYFIGWATEPDASVPDIVVGRTPVKDLDTVYAVWAPNTYYLEEGKDAYWSRGNADGLNFVIRREYDAGNTYRAFTDFFIDGVSVSCSAAEGYDGSLNVYVSADSLESLSVGSHTAEFRFGDAGVETQITIEEPYTEPTEEETEPTETEPEPEETEEYTYPPYEEPRETQVSRPGSAPDGYGPFWMTVLAVSVIAGYIYYRVKKREQEDAAVSSLSGPDTEQRLPKETQTDDKQS